MKNFFSRFALTINVFFYVVLLVSFLFLVFPILSQIILNAGWNVPWVTEKSYRICFFLKSNLYISFIFVGICGWVEFKCWEYLSELFKFLIKLSLVLFNIYLMFTLCYPLILKFGT